MSSHQVEKVLARLKEPRTELSLILETYGEATWLGCMLELQIADVLNWFLRSEPEEDPHFRAGDSEASDGRQSISQLIRELEKRKVLSMEHIAVLRDAADARHELIHRLVEKSPLITETDRRLLLSEIMDLRRRIYVGYELAKAGKIFYAEKVQQQVGLPTDFFERTIEQIKADIEGAEAEAQKLLESLENEGSTPPPSSL